MVVVTKLDRLLLDFAGMPMKRKDTGSHRTFVQPAVDAGTIAKWERGGYYVSEAGIERLREIGYDYDEDMEEPGRKTQLGHRVRNLTASDLEDKVQRELQELEDEVPDEDLAPNRPSSDYW